MSGIALLTEAESAGQAVRDRYYELLQAYRALIDAQVAFAQTEVGEQPFTAEENAYLDETIALSIEHLADELRTKENER